MGQGVVCLAPFACKEVHVAKEAMLAEAAAAAAALNTKQNVNKHLRELKGEE